MEREIETLGLSSKDWFEWMAGRWREAVNFKPVVWNSRSLKRTTQNKRLANPRKIEPAASLLASY